MAGRAEGPRWLPALRHAAGYQDGLLCCEVYKLHVIQSLGGLYDSVLLLISLSNHTSDPFKNVSATVDSDSRIDHLSSTFEPFLKNTMSFKTCIF